MLLLERNFYATIKLIAMCCDIGCHPCDRFLVFWSFEPIWIPNDFDILIISLICFLTVTTNPSRLASIFRTTKASSIYSYISSPSNNDIRSTFNSLGFYTHNRSNYFLSQAQITSKSLSFLDFWIQ